AVDPAQADREADAAFPATDGVVETTPAGAGSGAMATKTKAKPKPKAVDPSWTVSDAELHELATMKAEGPWRVAGQELKVTNLDKVLFPPRDGVEEQPATKRDLIGYFARIAPAMLAHLADRPLNLQRFPNGAGAPGFWQKDIPDSAPKWLTIWHE